MSARLLGRLARVSLLVLALPALRCAPALWDIVPPTAFASADSMSRAMPKLLEVAKVPGAAIAVIEHGRISWVRGFGWADTQRRVPVTDSTVFQVASISKAVTAWGVMRLVEKHALTLDAPVDGWLTRWHLPPSRYDARGVTVRRLLSHTAGLTDNAYQGYRPDTTLPSLEESLGGHNDGVGDVHIEYAPGTAWHYSEGGFTLLQLLVEERTGLRFAQYMRDTILVPLAMTSSAFEWEPRLRGRTATAYDKDERPLPNYLFTEEAPDGLYTTAGDLARFALAGMRGGAGEPPGRGVLSPETVSLMQFPVENSDGGWGLGVQLSTAVPRYRHYQHFGTNRGWKAAFVGYPEQQAGIVILTNGDNGSAMIRTLICAWAPRATGGGGDRC
jgi:CubicO group peptidase (beta-lactamase class C family)